MAATRLGIVANEFFDPEVRRYGGFGWAARSVARLFEEAGWAVDVVFVAGAPFDSSEHGEHQVHGRQLIRRRRSALRHARELRSEHLDLLLLIDYRPTYRRVCWSLPRTPIITWLRDPRIPDDVALVRDLRIPGAPGVQPLGTASASYRSLRTITRASRVVGRSIRFAATCESLAAKGRRLLGASCEPVQLLPNPVTPLPIPRVRKTEAPTVVVLGRLDPYKRPWIALELARRLPHVEFQFLGHAHFQGHAAWEPRDVPANAQFLGHRDGPDKYQCLSAAWALLNTSVHEGLAVSFLEALACETPLVACVDPDGLVSRFGRCVGNHRGTGMAAVAPLERALSEVLEDHDWRCQKGTEGRQFVERTHNHAQFLTSFGHLCAEVGVPLSGGAGSVLPS